MKGFKLMRWTFTLLLILALVIVTFGCIELYPSEKTTGGGLFYDSTTGNIITFGFNAQPSDDDFAKGSFQLIDHSNKIRIKGTFSINMEVPDPETGAAFMGTCSINGEGEHDLYAGYMDLGEPVVSARDQAWIQIDDPPILFYSGNLTGGNIQIHKSKT